MKLHKLSKNLFDFSKLKYLNLSNNFLQNGELDEIHKLEIFETLILENIGGFFSDDIFMLKNLKTLVLKNNSNANSSELFAHEFDLIIIDKRSKLFYKFMNNFLDKYYKPNLDFHSIKNIQCINLQKLSLENCNLTQIPNFVFDLINLSDLDLSENSIKKINKNFKNLTKLTTLNLSDNLIRTISNDFTPLEI